MVDPVDLNFEGDEDRDTIKNLTVVHHKNLSSSCISLSDSLGTSVPRVGVVVYFEGVNWTGRMKR